MAAGAGAAAASIAGGLMQVPLTFLNNKLERDNQQEARYENYIYGELSAEGAYRRTRQLYEDFYSPEALMRQYEAAGLSPSMMFGGTPGQGGMQGPQGGGASGLPAMYTPYSIVEAAQAAALFAEAKKTTAETEQIQPMTESEIAKNMADAGHADAAAAMLHAQQQGQELQNYVSSHTTGASIYQICAKAEESWYATQKMYHEMRSAKILGDVDEATFKEQVEMRSATLENIISSTAKNRKEAEKVAQDIKYQIYTWDLEYRKIDVQERQQSTYEQFITGQIAKWDKELEIRAKELGIEETGLWVHAVSDLIKDICIGGMAYASYRNTAIKAGNQAAGAAKAAARTKYDATKRGLNLERNKHTYPY